MKRAFTLIELLAVIVILAILALIVAPIISGVITNAKQSAAARSLEGYVQSIELAEVKYQSNNHGNIEKNINNISVEAKSINKIENDKFVLSDSGIVNNIRSIVDGYYCVYTSKNGANCSSIPFNNWELENDYDSNGIISKGDLISYGTEKFYVLSNNFGKIRALAQNNIFVGYIYDPTNGLTEITNDNGLQNDEVIGYHRGFDESNPNKGVVSFSSTNYWYDSISSKLKTNYGTSYSAYVYDSNSSIYSYVTQYNDTLENKGAFNITTSLISHDELVEFGCPTYGGECNTLYPWIYSSSYWTGSAGNDTNMWIVSSINSFGYSNSNDTKNFGVRPVIELNVEEFN